MLYETFRNSRSAGSSPMYCSPAFRAGEIAGGSGCVGGVQSVVGKPLEASLAARRRENAAAQASSWSRAEIAAAAATAVAGRFEVRDAALGLRAVWLDRPASSGF